MAFSDPLKPKFDNSAETECPRVSTGSYESTYQSADGLGKVRLATQNGSDRRRHLARLDLAKITTDPYDTSQNIDVSMSAYLVIDRPISGFTADEARKLAEGLKALLTEANLKKLVASES